MSIDWLSWKDGKVVIDAEKLSQWMDEEKELAESERLCLEIDYLESHSRSLAYELSELEQKVADLETELAAALRKFESLRSQVK
jgi:predicted  nucleic acid-binding Zn-ribbon protein